MKLRRRLLAVPGLAVLLVLGASGWVWARGRSLECERIDELRQAPVAIVLGAGVREDGTPSDALADRLEQGLELYRTGKVRKLLLSGDHGTRGYDETNCMRRWVLARELGRALEACEESWRTQAGWGVHAPWKSGRRVCSTFW